MRFPWRSIRRTALTLALCLGPAAIDASPLRAQVTPADSAAVLLGTAAAFEDAGAWEVAEALYLRILERFGSTPAAVEARARLAAPHDARLDRSGRVELQVWSTLYGLWLGIAVPAAFGADGPEPYGAGILLGGPTGLLGARALLRSRSLSQGQGRAITWGGTWGTWQGLGWAEVLDLGEMEICPEPGFCYTGGNTEEERFAAMIIGGLAGVTAGALLARDPIRSGVATGAHYGSLWGTWFGGASAILFDLDDDAAWTTMLLVGNAGLVAGAALAAKWDVSRNRIRLASLGGLVGGLAGVGTLLIVQPDGDEAILVPMVTSALGLAVGIHATRDYDAGPSTGGDDAAPSLLALRDGRLSVSAPMPVPTLLPFDDANGRPRWKPGLAIDLFRAVF